MNHSTYIHAETRAPIPLIPMQPVESTKLAEVGYRPDTQTLAVTFRSGKPAVYHYPNFPSQEYQALRTAESMGKHFGAHVQRRAFDKYVPSGK